MFSEDYIKRLIKMATEAMTNILGLKAAGQYQEALEIIDQMLEQVLGLKASLVKRMDDSSILSTLTKDDELDTERLLIVAELFKEEGDIHAAQGKTQASYWSYLRALNFFLEVVLNWGRENVSEPYEKIEALLPLIKDYELPAETLFAWFAYDEQVGNYARGAHVLERMASIPGLQADMQDELKAYYRRLLDEPDSELERGGLKKEQIRSKLENF